MTVPEVFALLILKRLLTVCQEGLWGKIRRHFGIPGKFVKVMMNKNKNTSCKRVVHACLSDSFKVKSGVIQGDNFLPLLFVLVIDYVVKRTETEPYAGKL